MNDKKLKENIEKIVSGAIKIEDGMLPLFSIALGATHYSVKDPKEKGEKIKEGDTVLLASDMTTENIDGTFFGGDVLLNLADRDKSYEIINIGMTNVNGFDVFVPIIKFL